MFYINITNIKKIIKLNKPILVNDLIQKYVPKLYNYYLAVIINNEIKDKNFLINQSGNIILILYNDNYALHIIKQSCAFLCAYAIKQIWPLKQEINLIINETGFTYYFDMSYRISIKDLYKIELLMYELLKTQSLKIKSSFITKNDTYKILSKNFEYYLLNNINTNLQQQKLYKIFHIENFISFNPYYVTNNKKLYTNFYLQDISGVYLNNSNKMIQKITCIVYNTKTNLRKYFVSFNKIKQIDHRKINQILNYYHIDKDNPGLVFWNVNGLFIFNKLTNFIRNKLKSLEYKEIKTPVMLNSKFWKKSGHLNYYKDYIFTLQTNNQEFCIKPMNCPAHVQIYKQKIKSYKDLPLKLSEFGNCFRNEPSGSLHGLMRLKSFTQDDAHIFCTYNQVNTVINECINLIYEVYNIFSFKQILVKLSTRPIYRYGSEKEWDKAELILANILIKNNIDFHYQLNSGAFYGPKIEFILTDSLNRQWQCGTLQIDFTLSKRLNIFYINKNNIRKNPIIIHRAILGSIERFIGIILEVYEGLLPIWLSPIQVIVINITSKQAKYATYIHNIFIKFKIRSMLDLRSENISFKIREHLYKKIHYIIICGFKEMENNKITVRTRNIQQINLIPINHFIYYLLNKLNY